MREFENIREVSAVLPDYLGFIFYDKSPRVVSDNFRLPIDIPKSIQKVAVFVNESPDRILEIVKNYNFDFVQFHGDESVTDCLKIKEQGIGVIKTFSIHDEFDLNRLRPYQSVVDYMLFDTKGKYYGGNAQKFNWELLHQYDQQIPFFLSGGV